MNQGPDILITSEYIGNFLAAPDKETALNLLDIDPSTFPQGPPGDVTITGGIAYIKQDVSDDTWPSRPITDAPVFWFGWDDPGITDPYDLWFPIVKPS